MCDELRAGQRVRLKSNPGRVGTLSGERIERKGSIRLEVHFEDGSEFVPKLALDLVTSEASSPYSLMRDKRFLRARDLRSALTHYRLSGRLADMIYSLDTTNTDFYAYQFKPVLSFLDSPCRGILIADEVGLGKTIEAGLIWTELRSRENARRLLVLCPAMLREKWRRELRDRFGIDAQLCSSGDLLSLLEGEAAAPGKEFAAIASLQGMRPPTGWDDEEQEDAHVSRSSALARFLRDHGQDQPMLDLVIVDEAHYLRNPETQTARFGRLVRPVAEHLVLLSATPIQLRSTDLFNLLNLLDRDTFPYESSFETALAQNAPLVRLRDRLLGQPVVLEDYLSALKDAAAAWQLGESEMLRGMLEQPPTQEDLESLPRRLDLAEQLDRLNPVSKVVSRTRKRDVHERRVVRAAVALRAEMSAVETRFYQEVTGRVREYCANRNIAEGFMLTFPQRQMCSSMAAACAAWNNRVDELDEEIEEIVWEAFGGDAETGRSSVKPLVVELSRMARDVGTTFTALKQADSKFALLRDQLLEYWRRFPDAKVILFAYFRATLHYLQERFTELGVSTALLMGGMDKDEVLRRFASPGGPRLLLSSEVASEGVDLQFSALVINYDLPWNPMRIEQRIGRIDRIGQKSDRILIWNIFLGDTLDDRVYTRLFDRLQIFEQALGASEAILGEQVREMSYELLRHHLSPEEEAAVIEQTRIAMENNAQLANRLEEQASRLVAHGDYLQIRINAARDLNRYVSSGDLLVYVKDFVESKFKGASFISVDEELLLYEVDLGAEARADFDGFLEQERLKGRTKLAAPGAGRQLCRFENRLGVSHPGAETVSQYHPLVRWVSQRRRAEAEAARHAPIAALQIDGALIQDIPAGSYVFAVQRWEVSGEHLLHRLAYEAALLNGQDSVPWLGPERAELLITSAALRGSNWLGAGSDLESFPVHEFFTEAVDALDSRYEKFVDRVQVESRDRINFQLQLLDRHEKAGVQALQELIAQLRVEGKMRTIGANEGRIRKLRERTADRRARLTSRLEITHEQRLAAGGVIRVV
jgi:superfamily II DNA or RNA helicase